MPQHVGQSAVRDADIEQVRIKGKPALFSQLKGRMQMCVLLTQLSPKLGYNAVMLSARYLETVPAHKLILTAARS